MARRTRQRHESVEAHLYLLVTMVFFGSAFTSSKVVVSELPHEVAAVLRFGGGTLVLLVLLGVARGRAEPAPAMSRGRFLRAGAVGMLGVFAYNVLFFRGLSLAPSIDGSVIVPVLSPVLTTLVLLSFRRESASAARIAGLALGMGGAGVFLLGAGGDASPLEGTRPRGDLVFLLGAACWAGYSIVSKRVLVGMEPLRATTSGMLVGSLGLLVFALPAMPEVAWAEVSASTWVNIGYLALGPTAVAYLCYYRALRTVSASTSTIMMFTVPVFGTTCSLLFLDETFTTPQLVGALVMLVGALLAVTRGRFRASPGREPTTASRAPSGPERAESEPG
ncbi:Permease of the drug/metabolite transporter (DMT) superfamily [Actinopolyspora xinjiangensis]|uniref:Permease of the drug/metabolite transporter (DMT) superfamily n=1 Tax=Actinopolyspora xinjiangensis TaxID=405564 RepID=A0A1H0QET1_9ACTN|nr:DMT family transporter [Actinopolyspora xinjiangensis]SDP15198.1 Permease of the drug/metabolite transporter (DMT) superfamily [Actinopolyspora xinjiangensis]